MVDANGTVLDTFEFGTREGTNNVIGLAQDDFSVTPRRVPLKSLPFSSRLALNRLDPQRIAIGTNYIYTTVDANGAADKLTLLNLGTPGSKVGETSALAYGTDDNINAVLAGTQRRAVPQQHGHGRLADAAHGIHRRLADLGGVRCARLSALLRRR